MAMTRGSYPHPVLDGSQDVDSKFEVFNVSFAPTIDDIEIKFQVTMDDPDIKDLIDQGLATYSFRWTCSATIMSKELDPQITRKYADSIGFVGWIDQQDVFRKTKVEFKIIAKQEIPNFKLRNQHSDYGNAEFSLLPGDLIGDAGYFEFNPRKLFDPMNPPVSSCFRFMRDRTLRKGISTGFHDDEQVLVLLSNSAFEGAKYLESNPALLASLIVLPALMETIVFIKDNQRLGEEDLTEKSWHQQISQLVELYGGFETPVLQIAQAILNHCIEESLSTPLLPDDMED